MVAKTHELITLWLIVSTCLLAALALAQNAVRSVSRCVWASPMGLPNLWPPRLDLGNNRPVL